MKHTISWLLALAMVLTLTFVFTACSSPEAETETVKPESAVEEAETAPAVADPETALEKIYEQLTRTTGLVDADDDIVSDVMGFDLETIEEYWIRYMETDFGASDVYIIKPVEGQEDTVRKDMKEWQESRIRAFSGYDIYNSTAISENAVIFTRGDYLVMLMLEDNDEARSILETYITEELDLND